MYDGSDNLLMRFDYADGRMPVSMTQGGITYYLAYDQTGSLKAVADSDGTVVKVIDYDSFGYIVDDSDESFQVPFGFAGGLHDRDTGLVRFGYRDYDPETGRWTAKDPILFEGGDSDLYGYVLNDPVNLIDPWGLVDLNLFPDADVIQGYADKIPAVDGTFTVGAHGFPYYIKDKNGKIVGYKTLAEMIKNDPNYKEGDTVQLDSCSTGKGPEPFAQYLADELNTTVLAPNDDLWITESGKTRVANGGTWETFYPRK